MPAKDKIDTWEKKKTPVKHLQNGSHIYFYKLQILCMCL